MMSEKSRKRPMKLIGDGSVSNKRRKKQKVDVPVNKKKEQHQNSAAVLSLWHCIFSWFYANCEQKHSYDKDAEETMNEVYGRMKALRYTIQAVDDYTADVDSIVMHFQKLIKKINQNSWKSVIKSMMHELMEMLRILKENKQEFAKDWVIQDANDVKNTKLKHLACLLTLWYWLAAWSNSDNDTDDLELAKLHYFQSIEFHIKELNLVLFTESHLFDDSICVEFQIMVSNLGALLRADPEHWINVLDHFIQRMVHAGSLRAQVRNVWADADRQAKRKTKQGNKTPVEEEPVEDDIPDETLAGKQGEQSQGGATENGTKPPETPAAPSEPLLVHGLGLLLKNVATQTPLSAIADKIPDAVSFVYHDIKKGDLKDIADHIPNVVGAIAGPEAKQIATAVVHGAEFVSEHVVDGVKEAAHVLGEGVHEFSKGVHTVFHSVKNFFSHLF